MPSSTPRPVARRSPSSPRVLVAAAAAALVSTAAAPQPAPQVAVQAAAVEVAEEVGLSRYAHDQLRSEVESLLGAARAAEQRRVQAYFDHVEAEAARAEAQRVAAQRAEAERVAAARAAAEQRAAAEAAAERARTERAAQQRRTTQQQVSSGAAAGGGWAALRRCESGGDYSAVSASGGYRGAYQFSRSTWDSVAAKAHPRLVGVDPAAAAPADQDAMAQALFDMAGSSPWPQCGRHLR